jgi:hypothetical protein
MGLQAGSHSRELDRWAKTQYPLDYHAEQSRFYHSPARFKIASCGRRSGKTEIAKQIGIEFACRTSNYDLPYELNVIFAGPTRDQAKRNFWRDLKQMIHPSFKAQKPSESELTIKLHTNATIRVVGMDVPERVEGSPIDWIDLDEAANMKPEVWENHVRPGLDTLGRPGQAVLTSTPDLVAPWFEELYESAKTLPDWDTFWWPSADILPPEVIEAARQALDPLTFKQEYEGSFVTAGGRVYYSYDKEYNTGVFEWQPEQPDIGICFDFNVDPYCVTLVQEQFYKYDGLVRHNPRVDPDTPVTIALDEIYLRNANTVHMAEEIKTRWGHMLKQSTVSLYGDATGGNRGTAKIHGSDWQILDRALKPFCRELIMCVPRANPAERTRVNAVNSRAAASDGTVRFLVDHRKCPYLMKDLRGVTVKPGTSGQIDKDIDKKLTHASDGFGYYIVYRYPIGHAIQTGLAL